jgi:hypothetical protein
MGRFDLGIGSKVLYLSNKKMAARRQPFDKVKNFVASTYSWQG